MEENAEHKGEIDKQAQIEALKARGSEAFNAGSFGDAITIWQGALALNPGDAGLKEMLSAARKQADLLIKEAELKAAEDARKQWVDDVVARVNNLFQKGTYREAESMLQQALQHEPTNAQFIELLATCREKLTKVQREKTVKPRSKRKLLYYAIGLAVILTAIIYYSIESDDSPGSSYIPPAAVDNPPAPIDKPPVPIETPPPPLDVVGNWTYTVTQPDGSRVNGQMVIAGSNDQLRMIATAAYTALGPDGWRHNFREQNYFAGSLAGDNLLARSTSGTLFVDGVAYAPPGYPFQFDLQVSSDGRSMNGQVSSSSTGGAASVSAQRQR